MHPCDGRVISNFLVQALQNLPITVYGEGSQTRSFCYIQDMIEALVRTMDTPSSFIGPINLGNPVEITILELVRIIVDLTGSSAKIVFRPLPEDDPRQRRPDITLARTIIDWEPVIPFQEGLTRTAIFFKNILGQEKTPLLSAGASTPRMTDLPAGGAYKR
jgi:UDP-glucuronate decarboxylase